MGEKEAQAEFDAKYPQHALAKKYKAEITAIAEFVDLGPWAVGRWEYRNDKSEDCEDCEELNTGVPEHRLGQACRPKHQREEPFFVYRSMDPGALAGEYYGIDYKAYMEEKDSMLADLRAGTNATD